MTTLLKSVDTDEWTYREFGDGTEQWVFRLNKPNNNNPFAFVVERVVRADSQRPDWCVVRRPEGTSNTMYPESEAGPFPDADSGKAAMRLLMRVAK